MLTSDQLRELLLNRVNALTEKVAAEEASLTAEEIAALDRLAKLYEIRKQAAAPPRKAKWPIAVFFVTIVGVALLWSIRLPETQIELEAECTSVSFTLPKAEVLSNEFASASIGASALSGIDLPRAKNRPPSHIGSDGEGDRAVELSVGPNGDGFLNMAELIPASGAAVTISGAGADGRYSLSLRGAGVQPRIDAGGTLQVRCPPEPALRLTLLSPQSFTLTPARGAIHLELLLPAGSQGAFSQNLGVTKLDLARVDEFQDAQHSIVNHVSTIMTGALYRDALNGEKRAIRAGENLRFRKSDGIFRKLQLKGDHIAIDFHGSVRGMSTGSEEAEVDLMPTLLEWLQARHGLSLFWGATLYGFGLLVGVFKWYGLKF